MRHTFTRHERVAALVLLAAALDVSLLAACRDDATANGQTNPAEADAASSDGGDGGSDDGSVLADDGSPDADASSLLEERPYRAKKSSKYDGSTEVPLVVLLHAYTATASLEDSYFQLSALAEEKNFLVALPEGKTDAQGDQFWNASDACCDFFASGVDDVAYLKAVIADMKSKFKVDPKRVSIVGHSNGGFMAHRLACELSDEIASIVSLAGVSYADAAKCKATSPVAVLQVHGDADDTVLYTGGSFIVGAPAYPSAKDVVAMWAGKNGCDATLNATNETLDLDTSLAGSETNVARHACTVAGAAELWTIAGGGHIPSFGTTWAPALYAFIEAHPKP